MAAGRTPGDIFSPAFGERMGSPVMRSFRKHSRLWWQASATWNVNKKYPGLFT